MKQFVFLRHSTHTVCVEDTYFIDADTYEEAKQEFIRKYHEDDPLADDNRWLFETAEPTGDEEFYDEYDNLIEV